MFHLHPHRLREALKSSRGIVGSIYYCPPGLTCFDAAAANSASQPANHPTSQPDERTNGHTDRHTGKIDLPAGRRTTSPIPTGRERARGRATVPVPRSPLCLAAAAVEIRPSCIVKRGITGEVVTGPRREPTPRSQPVLFHSQPAARETAVSRVVASRFSWFLSTARVYR